MDHGSGLDLIERDIERESDVLRSSLSTLREMAATLANGFPRPSHVYLVGCGDSLDGATAARFAIDDLVGMPVEAFPAMTFRAGIVDGVDPDSLVVGISQSGKVSRVIEAVRAARQRGLKTLTVTSNPTSPIAEEPADACWHVELEKLGPVPGMTSHLMGAVAMYELGAALATDRAAGDRLRADIDLLPDLVETTIASTWPIARDHATQFDRDLPVLALGYGATMTAARFTARRLLELAQVVAISQETEEYAHDEYSIVDHRFRVLLFAPQDYGVRRSAEVANYLQRLKVNLAVIGDSDVANGIADVDYRLPAMPSSLSPLVAAVPGQLLSLEVARRLGGSLYGNGDPIHEEDGERQIYESEIVTA